MKTELEVILDEMVRDFTQVGSRPKSEVRRRIVEFVDAKIQEKEKNQIN